MNNCKCKVDETTGWTTVRCCNVCGKSVENFWYVPKSIENETLSTTIDLMRSVIDKLINASKPTYSEAEKMIIKESIDRHFPTAC